MKNIILLLTISLVLTGCGNNASETKNETVSTEPETFVVLTPAQHQAANITFGKIEQKVMGTTLQVNGQLDVPAENLVTMAAPMGGFVKSAKLLPGMSIKKGAIIAVLENQEYIQLQQDYLTSKSQFDFLQAEYNRQTELAKENINAGKSLEHAKSQYESMRANVKGLEAKLSMINITPESLQGGNIRSTINLYAPISGFVSEANVTTGQYVNATDMLLKIVDITHIHAELQVYEKDISKIAVGQRVTFQLVNGKDTYAASVLLIGKEISPEHTVIVHCHLDKEDKNLLPGMFVTANIETGAEEVDVVPASAIVNFEGDDIIFARDAGLKFNMIAVKTGKSTGAFTEIKLPEGFNRSTEIVVTGAFELLGVLKNKEEEE